jgi:ABC-type nickel/cobalt efflux system permease component RcnA
VSPGGPAATLPGISSRQRTTSGSALLGEATRLMDSGGLGAAVLALALALALGAGHALAPGHGKTVMAFYLSQRDGAPIRSAAAVGATVTAAHTGSVLLLGVLVSASTQFVPARIYPWLALVTGVLIVALGVSLLRQARRGGHTHGPGGHTHGPGGHTHEHGHEHSHPDDHGHEHKHEHEHEHDHEQRHSHAPTVLLVHEEALERPHPHEHPHVPAARAGRRGLATMGLVGGLVPSPSALVLLLGAVALGKAWFGVLLVLAFGLGMATTLAMVGLLATDLLGRAERLLARRTRLAVPVRAFLVHGAALGVCVIGLGVMLRAAGGLA